MTDTEIEAKNYAINRRKESYDAESEIFELENAGILKPDEIEKVIEDVRIESFIAGVSYMATALHWNSYKDIKPPLDKKVLILCMGNSLGPFITTRIFENEIDYETKDIYGWITIEEFHKINIGLSTSGYELFKDL